MEHLHYELEQIRQTKQLLAVARTALYMFALLVGAVVGWVTAPLARPVLEPVLRPIMHYLGVL